MISIIIPAYNAEQFIKNTINSILNQSYQDFEIVVVNDGSKDRTKEIVEELAKLDNRIHLISQKNQGVSAARNVAIEQAKGDFLTMVDADDTLPKNALRDMISLIDDEVDMVIGSHNEIRIKSKSIVQQRECFKAAEIPIRFLQIDPLIWSPWAKLYRRSIIVENGLKFDSNISFGEDHLFIIDYIKYINKDVVVTDSIVYNYFFLRGGLCSKYYSNMHELQKYVLDGIFSYSESVEGFPKQYQEYYVQSYLLGCFEYYISWLSFEEAVKKVEESVQVFSDFLTPCMLEECFDSKQMNLLEKQDYKELVRDYVKKNIRKTVVRKYRRKIRIVLEKCIGL